MTDTTNTPAHSSEHNAEQAARTAFVARHPEGFNGTQWQEFRAGWDTRHELDLGRTQPAQPTANAEGHEAILYVWGDRVAVSCLCDQWRTTMHNDPTPEEVHKKFSTHLDLFALTTPPPPQPPDRGESWAAVAVILERLAPCGLDVGDTLTDLKERLADTALDFDREGIAHDLWTMGAWLEHKKCPNNPEKGSADANYSNGCEVCETYLRAVADSIVAALDRSSRP